MCVWGGGGSHGCVDCGLSLKTYISHPHRQIPSLELQTPQQSQRSKLAFFKRNVTPVNAETFAQWKTDKAETRKRENAERVRCVALRRLVWLGCWLVGVLVGTLPVFGVLSPSLHWTHRWTGAAASSSIPTPNQTTPPPPSQSNTKTHTPRSPPPPNQHYPKTTNKPTTGG